MPSCVVKWCRSHTDMKNSGITFHTFPRTAVQRYKWVSAVRLERHESDWMPSACSKICSIHFHNDDIYLCDKGKVKRLRKTAVPVCTMVTSYPIEPCGSIKEERGSSPSSIKQEPDIKEEDEYSYEVNWEDTNGKTFNCVLEKPGCSYLQEKNDKLTECSDPLNTVNFDPSCSSINGNTIKQELDETSSRNEEEKKRILIECPSCKYYLTIETEMFKNVAILPTTDVSATSVASSQLESVFNTHRIRELEKKLTAKTSVAQQRLFKLKNLQRINRRLKNKNLAMKDIIANLKKNGRAALK